MPFINISLFKMMKPNSRTLKNLFMCHSTIKFKYSVFFMVAFVFVLFFGIERHLVALKVLILCFSSAPSGAKGPFCGGIKSTSPVYKASNQCLNYLLGIIKYEYHNCFFTFDLLARHYSTID